MLQEVAFDGCSIYIVGYCRWARCMIFFRHILTSPLNVNFVRRSPGQQTVLSVLIVHLPLFGGRCTYEDSRRQDVEKKEKDGIRNEYVYMYMHYYTYV